MNIVSINLGEKKTLEYSDQRETTGIFKHPVTGPVRVGSLGLDGDFIASAKHHGGPDQAVYVYGLADYEWWSQELGRDLVPGTFGENLTITGLESARFSIGDRLMAGTVILEVTAARIPCGTFARRMDDSNFVQRFRDAERPGLYCRVLREGIVQVGEHVTLEPCRGETVTLIEFYRAFYEQELSETALNRLLAAPIAIRARKIWAERVKKLKDGMVDL